MGIGGAAPPSRPEVWQGLIRSLTTPALRRLGPGLVVHECDRRSLARVRRSISCSRVTPPAASSVGLLADDPARLGGSCSARSCLAPGSSCGAGCCLAPTSDGRCACRCRRCWACRGALAAQPHGRLPISLRWGLTAVIAVLVMVESGFTPAALSCWPRRSVLAWAAVRPWASIRSCLSVGALRQRARRNGRTRFAIDGLTYATVGLAVLALTLLPRLEPVRLPRRSDR